MDRLQRLIFSYYREEPALQQLLQPLHSCRMRRSWGSVRIECRDDGHLEEVSALLGYLREPLAALDLGRQIVLRGSGSRQRSYPMHVPFHCDQLARGKSWRSTIRLIDRMQLACDFGRG